MNELPQVLQKEIWEYVHGDRAYWKQQFKTVLKVIPYINQNLRKQIDDRSRELFLGDRYVDARFETSSGTLVVAMSGIRIRDEWQVWIHRDWVEMHFESGQMKFEEAVKLFYEKVEIEAINRA